MCSSDLLTHVYVYQYPEMISLKHELNSVKQKLDPIHVDPASAKKYATIANLVRSHDDLRGPSGILAKDYGAEIVTNAWLKMFELMNFAHSLLDKLQKSKTKKTFNSLHVAEAPGNFLLSINHKLRTEYPSVEWNWLASSFRDLYSEGNVHYLEDQYGLISAFPNNWIFGADGDGDITSVANIRSFAQSLQDGECQLVTSDVKYVPIDVNFDEEENINIPVHLGHLLIALTSLSKGGIMILKEFTLFEAPSISMVYLMTQCFNNVRIVKPETSRPANSEIYIVGIDYKKNLNLLQIEALLDIMKYIRPLNTEAGSPAIFRKNDIPQTFVDKIVRIQSALVRSQIKQIERNLALFEKYTQEEYRGNDRQIKKDLGPLREATAKEWIEKTGIRVLNREHWMMKPRESYGRRGGRENYRRY